MKIDRKYSLPKFAPGDPGTITVGINLQLLVQLVKLMGIKEYLMLTLKLPPVGSEMLDPILVGEMGSDLIGVMPISTKVVYSGPEPKEDTTNE